MRKFAISDIHGCLKTFKALLQKLDFQQTDKLFLLGDYIDRGSDSKGVLDYIFDLMESGYQVKCLLGNHEQLLLEGLDDLSREKHWVNNCGGKVTLASFNTDDIHQLPKVYLDFINKLEYYHLEEEYILVHAGLNFDVPEPLEAKHSLIWIRDWYADINYDWLGERIIVHGHTPIGKSAIEEMGKILEVTNVLDIDAGCVYPHPRLNHLCAFELTTKTLTFQSNVE